VLLLDCDEGYMRHNCATAVTAASDATAEDADKNAATEDVDAATAQDATEDGDAEDDAVMSRRIAEYKHKTLPVLGYLDDVDKLDIVMVIAVYQNCILNSFLLHSMNKC